MPKVPGHRLTLIGVDDQTIELSTFGRKRPDGGVFLHKAPDFLNMLDVEHQHTRVVGALGGLWESMTVGPMTRTLSVRVKGRNVRLKVRELLAALGDGSKVFRIVHRDEEAGFHWLTGRLKTVSTTVHGHYMQPTMVEVEAQFMLDRPVWSRFQTLAEFTNTQIQRQRLEFPHEGTVPFWPVIEVEGTFTEVRLRLHESDAVQVIRQPARVISDPDMRSILQPNGNPTSLTPVAWLTPVTPSGGRAAIYAQVTGAGSNFRLKVSAKTEVKTVW